MGFNSAFKGLIKQYNQKHNQPFCNNTAPASLDAKITQDVPRLG